MRPLSVGFDDMFDHFEKIFDQPMLSSNYPPYNIVKTNKGYNIEIALAGFSKSDVNIFVENGIITIESKSENKSKDNTEVLHKGISKRYFKRQFSISDDIKVNEAELKDGMLTILLEKIIPEDKKLKNIKIK
jgi:molecular chaperone IbpA